MSPISPFLSLTHAHELNFIIFIQIALFTEVTSSPANIKMIYSSFDRHLIKESFCILSFRFTSWIFSIKLGIGVLWIENKIQWIHLQFESVWLHFCFGIPEKFTTTPSPIQDILFNSSVAFDSIMKFTQIFTNQKPLKICCFYFPRIFRSPIATQVFMWKVGITQVWDL